MSLLLAVWPLWLSMDLLLLFVNSVQLRRWSPCVQLAIRQRIIKIVAWDTWDRAVTRRRDRVWKRERERDWVNTCVMRVVYLWCMPVCETSEHRAVVYLFCLFRLLLHPYVCAIFCVVRCFYTLHACGFIIASANMRLDLRMRQRAKCASVIMILITHPSNNDELLLTTFQWNHWSSEKGQKRR